jgi:hypothetical protein
MSIRARYSPRLPSFSGLLTEFRKKPTVFRSNLHIFTSENDDRIWQNIKERSLLDPVYPLSVPILRKKPCSEGGRIRVRSSPGIWVCPSPLETTIALCIVAKCGHIRARKWRQNGNQRHNWPISENRVPLFAVLLPYGPPEGARGG